jgi:histidine ammonia-lyase
VARGHAAVRRLVAPLDQDRVLSPDIEALAAAIANDELSPSMMVS